MRASKTHRVPYCIRAPKERAHKKRQHTKTERKKNDARAHTNHTPYSSGLSADRVGSAAGDPTRSERFETLLTRLDPTRETSNTTGLDPRGFETFREQIRGNP